MSPSPSRFGGSQPARRNQRQHHKLPTSHETSAGGLVLDANHQNAALIAKPGRRGDLLWSMPKGHIEKGETAEQTAIREVNEETGIQARVLHKLGVIDYWFVMDEPRNKPGKPAKPRRRIHKTVHHFVLEAIGGEL